jgi:hypothetical protein
MLRPEKFLSRVTIAVAEFLVRPRIRNKLDGQIIFDPESAG